jgi:hypothetical protein
MTVILAVFKSRLAAILLLMHERYVVGLCVYRTVAFIYFFLDILQHNVLQRK